jgi:hypothetical protein
MRRRLRERGGARGCALRSLLGANRRPCSIPILRRRENQGPLLTALRVTPGGLGASAVSRRAGRGGTGSGRRSEPCPCRLPSATVCGRRSSSTPRAPTNRHWGRRCGRPGPWHRSSAGRERVAPPIFRRPAPAARRFRCQSRSARSLSSPKVLCWSTQV